ncbi:hypothetical protein C1H46_036615 [Malus baccata]|uniref:Uncharacterized protein n=1 Tax=Malus baccata TaxID=106549 RepID=A0A540KUE3_MALBA|nr:hypothetical protein C1H46_036615 [Malus baccata]
MGVSPILPFGPAMSEAHASSASSVTNPLLSAKRTHQQSGSSKEAEQSVEVSSVDKGGIPDRVVPTDVKTVALHEILHLYDLTNLDANKKRYIHEICIGQFTQWYDSMMVRRRLKFPEIDMFNEVQVWPNNMLAKQLHATMVEKSQTVLQEVASQLLLETSTRGCGSRRGCWFSIMTDTLDHPSIIGRGMFTKGLGMPTIETCLPSPPDRE